VRRVHGFSGRQAHQLLLDIGRHERRGGGITIEGVAQGGKLHPLQEAFIEHDAFQCGYCTPGQICSAIGLLQEGKAHSAEEIRELMSGNICRCGAYPNIVAAIEQVIQANGRNTGS